MTVSDVAQGSTGVLYYLEQLRMLAMDKLGAKLDRNYAGVVVSVNSSAHPLAGFNEHYLKARHSEIACSRQTGGARA
jgi:hypothetical protein